MAGEGPPFPSSLNGLSSLSDSFDTPVDPSTTSRDILDTNDPPAEFNLSCIREFVSRGSARRAVLDSKIAPLQEELEKLLSERNSLDTDIRKHEGALSPLRRMPTEIISFIFTFALPPFAYSSNIMTVQEGPWILAAVCSRWRKIVLSCPCFWTSLSLDFTDDDPEAPLFASLVPTLEAHLERSQQLPLDITFRTFYEHRCTEREQELLQLLALNCHRWETITFSGPRWLYTLLEEIRDDLRILRKLDITVHEFEEDAEPLDLFQTCPKLQEAFVNAGGCTTGRLITVELPFSQLRRYSASNPWINHDHALRSASNLVDCVLHLDSVFRSSAGSTIVLPRLLRLSVSANAFLNCLDTPALQELYCCDQSSPLHSFLMRQSKLQKLFVGDTPSVPDITRLLRAASTITNLALYLPIAFVGDLFSAFEPQISEPTNNIPALETISIRVIREPRLGYDVLNTSYLDQDLFMDTVESHWQRGNWRSVNVFCPKFIPSAITRQRTEALRGQGMRLQVFPTCDSLLDHVVPPDFCLFSDFDDFIED